MSNLTETQQLELNAHVEYALKDIVIQDDDSFWNAWEWIVRYMGCWNPYAPELRRMYYESGISAFSMEDI